TNLISAQMVVPFITNPDLDWDEWNRRGMAIFRATGGCKEGFELFDALSRKSAKYDARATRARWQHYHRSPPERIGIGSLFHWASQSTPDWRDQLDKELMEELERAARECSGRSLYELCGVADPEEQAAGEPAIKKPAPELPPDQPQTRAAAAEQPAAKA